MNEEFEELEREHLAGEQEREKEKVEMEDIFGESFFPEEL